MHGLEAVEFRRLNKVGSNSRPNAFPLLLGRTTEAIVKKVMNVPTIEPDLSYNDYCNRYLDDIPYIPLEYKKAGYQMFGAEDYTASILNYPNCKGTKERQFEHSYRPLHSRLRDDKELKNIHLSGACRLLHSIMLDYLSKFVKSNKGWPKFALTWLVDIAHDNTKHLYRGDYELYSFFLNNRHDNQPDSKFNDTTFKRSESNPRGSSLLRKFELGIRRTCKTLPIPFQYCTCQYKKENVSDIELLSELGKFAVQKLAGILRENNVESKCAKIEIGNEVAAEKYVVPNAKHRLLYNLFDVTFTVAEPALGKFRIPVRMKKGKFELAGDQFDRLDKYGKNGDCMKQDILRPICTCNRG
ncbi:unnamed protein product [Nippostrongylus brasiliensis]|uniref:DUF1985 domain-containing protein n=1 Tax=Nippostrongylus brasiliensis TaxID=27835 RepID=A0A158QY58_NIPBR|nr:unnamed protein product [Nippostrongylus brasiliensis]